MGQDPAAGPRDGPDALSAREKQVLRLLLAGHDAKSSARELGLSVHTVNEHLREARRKLGVSSSREAARRLADTERGPPIRLVPSNSGWSIPPSPWLKLRHRIDVRAGRMRWPGLVEECSSCHW